MKLLSIIVLLFMWTSGTSSDHCVWYDECYHDDFAKNCPYNGTAKSLNETGVKILEKWCPSFLQNFSELPVKTCCSVAQLQTLDSSLQMGANFLKRCPSCMMNFASLFCEFTCAPNQSNFMKVFETKKENNVSYITGVDVYVNNTFLNGIYESCSHVSVPSTGELALDMMCGDYGASRCNTERWFKFLGDPELNPVAPFTIRFDVNATPGFSNLLSRITPCNESYNENITACSCIDCINSCPAPPPPLVPPKPFTILGYSGINVIMLIVFLSLLALIVAGCVRRPVRDFFESRVQSNGEFAEPNEQTPLVDKKIRSGAVNDSYCGDCIYRLLQKIFYKLGVICASYPKSVLIIGVIIICISSSGIKRTKLTTDPVQLWSSTKSGARVEKDYFDTNFGPFYRTEQIIIKPIGLKKIIHNTSLGPVEFGPVFNKTFMLAVYDLQRQIELLGNSTEDSLQNICFAPLSSPFRGPVQISDCMVESIWGYYQDDLDNFNETEEESNFTVNYLDHFKACTQNPYNMDCLARYGGPIDPALVVGGFLNENDTLSGNTQYEKATALIISFIVSNNRNETALQPALQWEKLFVDFMKNWTKTKPDFMDVAFSSERSIQDELQRSSEADIKTILISYLTMFLYVALALGSLSRLGRHRESSNLCWKIGQYIASGIVGAKIALGLGGICMVLVSVAASVGFFGFVGVPVTLIIIEVMPFLILAIGVDNIFIIVQSYQRSEKLEHESKQQHIGRVLSSVGPSILLSTMSECLCFFLGATSGMPAVREFALYAGFALVINFLLQVTCFISLLSLDSSSPLGGGGGSSSCCCCCLKTTCHVEASSTGLLYEFFKAAYTPFLMYKFVRFIVLTLFFGLFCFSVTVIPKLDVGLDQELAMPRDSYVSKYFKFLREYLSIGPPVYFVVEGDLDYSQSYVQNALCGSQYCANNSLTAQVFSASRRQNETHIARPANSWIDDYFDWSDISGCCKYFSNNGSFCPNDHYNCRYCNISFDHFNRPQDTDFKKYLTFFLQDNPTKTCAKAGHAIYSSAVKYKQDKNGLANVTTSYFMSYHTAVKKSRDYYEALHLALTLSENISFAINKALNHNTSDSDVKVFPYSVFYVFYEQYLTMWFDTLNILGKSVAGIFVVTFVLMNFDIVSALILTVTIIMIVVDIIGVMYWWHISLNAVSLINLALSLGISVEFCSHILHFYVHSDGDTRLLKASDSLSNVGSSVFSGITMTKFVGITVLAFAKSPLFQVFYFRMYLLIILFGAAHGLIFLPVLLSAIGPQRTIRENETKPINSETVENFEDS